MRIFYTSQLKIELKTFPKEIRQKFYKQAGFLLKNLHHPSLHAKKYREDLDIWQARIDKNIRFYFIIQKDTYVLLRIKKHSN